MTTAEPAFLRETSHRRFNPLRGESGEAAIKYYVLGGFSSAIFVYGIALVYGATGSTNLGQIANYFTQNQLIHSGLFDAGMALLCTHMSASVAGLVWALLEWKRFGRSSMVGIVTGVVAGLAAITPASGFVGPLGGLIFGAVRRWCVSSPSTWSSTG